MPKPQIIRLGDRVRVIKPERFIRCGYPLSVEDMLKVIDTNPQIQEALKALLSSCGIKYSRQVFHASAPVDFAWDERFRRGLAYTMLKANNFGGSDRRLRFKPCPEYVGQEFIVDRVSTVYTGDRYAGHYDHEYQEYTKGGLENRQAHRIASVWSPRLIQSTDDSVAFPVTHLEKVVP